MAVIDIGAAASDRGSSMGNNLTIVAIDNPANDTGILTSVELWFDNNATGVKAGTFYGSDTDYTCRDYATIGDVIGDSKQTFSGLDIDVEVGDFIGLYAVEGVIESDATGGAGIYWKVGDQFDAGQQTYTSFAGDVISAYGEGATEPAIDIGAAAEDRDSTGAIATFTMVCKENPANAAGTITSVEVWMETEATEVRVGTFIDGGSNVLSTRDYEDLGTVAAGSKQTFSDLDMDVSTGDYIGIQSSSGAIEMESSGGSGYWYKNGDYIPCTSQTFSVAVVQTISLYGEGATEAPPAGQPYSTRVQGVQGMRTWGGF